MNYIRSLPFLLVFCLAGLGSERIQSAEPTQPTVNQSVALVDINADEFGVAYSYQAVRAKVRLTNVSPKVLEISEVRPRLEADDYPSGKSIRLEVGASKSIEVEIQTGSAKGRLARYFDLYSDAGNTLIGSFAVRGYVDWIVDPESVTADFGNVDVESGVVRTLDIKERPGARLELLKVIEEGAHFSTQIKNGGRSVHLTSKKDAPLGLFDEYIVVSTSDRNQRKLGIRVRGQFFSGVLASSNPVDFGLLRIGDSAEQIVRLENLAGAPIDIGEVSTDGAAATPMLEDCIPRGESCKNLRIRLPAQEVRGQIGGVVHLELLPSRRDYPVNFGVVVIGKDTQIRSFEDDLKAASEAEPAVSDVLKSAIRKPVAPFEMPKPDGHGPLLTWQAANEHGVYGYEIYRGESEKGPFARVSSDFIKRLDESATVGSIYRWRDTTAEQGTTYFYYVGLVFEDGRRREFTSPQRVVAK